MTLPEYPEAFLQRLKAVKGKRSRIIVDHILQSGFITTEELENTYGYRHAPRAARDVREQGIPLETFYVKDAAGRTIAAYRFGDISQVERAKLGGRKVFSKAFKRQLYELSGGRCEICQTRYEARYLQIDHRVPYLVAGDVDEQNLTEFMLVCGSCNRAKSWSCEYCKNGIEIKDSSLCKTCYWASPDAYQHIALRPIRRLDVTWSELEIAEYDELMKQATLEDKSVSEHIKDILRNHLKGKM